MKPTVGTLLLNAMKTIFIVAISLVLTLDTYAQQPIWGLRTGLTMLGSFNANGGGPAVGISYKRHEISAATVWDQFATSGIQLGYRFYLPKQKQRVRSFLQVSVPICINYDLLARIERIGSVTYETFYDGKVIGVHFAIGSEIKLWRNLNLNLAAGLGHNWIKYIDYPFASQDYDVATSTLQFGLTYTIPLKKSAPTPPLEPETDPDLWIGAQVESPMPVFYAPLATGSANYYQPYAEARLTPHMRLRASAWIGPQTIATPTDTSTRWGVHGVGLAARFYSMQLRRLQFFHSVGVELVPRRFSPLHHNNLALANGFSYDIAHRVNLEAGMNLHINTDDYYMSPFFGVALPFTFSKLSKVK